MNGKETSFCGSHSGFDIPIPCRKPRRRFDFGLGKWLGTSRPSAISQKFQRMLRIDINTGVWQCQSRTKNLAKVCAVDIRQPKALEGLSNILPPGVSAQNVNMHTSPKRRPVSMRPDRRSPNSRRRTSTWAGGRSTNNRRHAALGAGRRLRNQWRRASTRSRRRASSRSRRRTSTWAWRSSTNSRRHAALRAGRRLRNKRRRASTRSRRRASSRSRRRTSTWIRKFPTNSRRRNFMRASRMAPHIGIHTNVARKGRWRIGRRPSMHSEKKTLSNFLLGPNTLSFGKAPRVRGIWLEEKQTSRAEFFSIGKSREFFAIGLEPAVTTGKNMCHGNKKGRSTSCYALCCDSVYASLQICRSRKNCF